MHIRLLPHRMKLVNYLSGAYPVTEVSNHRLICAEIVCKYEKVADSVGLVIGSCLHL